MLTDHALIHHCRMSFITCDKNIIFMVITQLHLSYKKKMCK